MLGRAYVPFSFVWQSTWTFSWKIYLYSREIFTIKLPLLPMSAGFSLVGTQHLLINSFSLILFTLFSTTCFYFPFSFSQYGATVLSVQPAADLTFWLSNTDFTFCTKLASMWFEISSSLGIVLLFLEIRNLLVAGFEWLNWIDALLHRMLRN